VSREWVQPSFRAGVRVRVRARVRLSLALAFAVGLGLCLAPAPAAAQDNIVFAQQRYARAMTLFTARDYTNGLAEFRASLALYPSPNTRLMVARCLRELGRLGEAAYEFQATLVSAQSDTRYVAARDAARTEMRTIEPLIGHLTVTIRDLPEGARVRIGERELPAAAIGLPLPVTPGRQYVTVEAPGYDTVNRTVEVALGGRESIALRPTRSVAPPVVVAPVVSIGPPPSTTPSSATVSDSSPRSGGSPAVTALFVGLGVAGVGGGAALLVSANMQFNDLSRRCGGVTCPVGEVGAIDAGVRTQILSAVAFGAGAAFVGIGVLYGVLSRGRPRSAVTPVALLHGGGVAVEF